MLQRKMYERYISSIGNDFKRGFDIGVNLKAQIQTNYLNQVRFYKETENYDYKLWEKNCSKYIPYIEKWAPEVLEELKGMAEGAEISFESILAMSTAYEKSFGCEKVGDKCTAFLATNNAVEGNGTICAQTNDERFDEWLHELDVVIHHKDDLTGLEVLTYTHPGVPAYMGMNNKGLAVLWTYIDNGQAQNGVPTNIIIRKLLNMETIEKAVEYLKSIPHAIPNQFSLAHADGKIVCVECFPNKIYVKYGVNYLTHTNHNTFADEKECTCSWSTYQRREEVEKLVKQHYGKLNVERAKEILASHKGFPYSICVHPNEHKPLGKTLAAMIYDLNCGEMHIAFGNACCSKFYSYRFNQYLSK